MTEQTHLAWVDDQIRICNMTLDRLHMETQIANARKAAFIEMRNKLMGKTEATPK